MRKLTLLLLMLVLAEAQTLSLASYARFFNIQPVSFDGVITATAAQTTVICGPIDLINKGCINSTTDGGDQSNTTKVPENNMKRTDKGSADSNNDQTNFRKNPSIKEHFMLRANQSVDPGQIHNYLNVNRGNILLTSNSDVCIGTPTANIYVSAGATIFLMESGNDTVLYDLCQTGPKQVSIMLDNTKLIMEPGRLLVLTKQNTANFKDLEANCHSINYRRAKQLDLQNEVMKGFVADFSVCSALKRIEPLKQLAISNDRKDKLVMERILKGAIARSSFTGNNESFIGACMGR